MLLPGFLSTEAPHSLRTIGVLPIVTIFAAQGLYWIITNLHKWHISIDPHVNPRESRMLAKLALIIFLVSLVFLEYHRYFNVWSKSEATKGAFNQNYVELAKELNNLPDNIRKYVVVNTGGVLVNNIPTASQTVMFLTDTFTPAKQSVKNIFYLKEEQYKSGDYHRNSVIFLLEK